jgi:hypothetical protein
VEVVAVNSASLHWKGIVPAGWKKEIVQPTYARHAYLFDPTLVNVQSFPGSKSSVLAALSSSFESSGFEETPRKTGSRSANGLTWTIYQSKFNGEPVSVALAQVSSRRTLALIMVVSAPERDAFYKGLFIPMLDALEYVP